MTALCPHCGREIRANLPRTAQFIRMPSGKSAYLTPTEWALFSTLRKAKGGLVTMRELMAALPRTISEKSLTVHIYHMRVKLEVGGWLIKNLHSQGYYLVPNNRKEVELVEQLEGISGHV